MLDGLDWSAAKKERKGLTWGTALLSTLADAALVVTALRAAMEEMAGRVRRGTARVTLTARENMVDVVVEEN